VPSVGLRGQLCGQWKIFTAGTGWNFFLHKSLSTAISANNSPRNLYRKLFSSFLTVWSSSPPLAPDSRHQYLPAPSLAFLVRLFSVTTLVTTFHSSFSYSSLNLSSILRPKVDGCSFTINRPQISAIEWVIWVLNTALRGSELSDNSISNVLLGGVTPTMCLWQQIPLRVKIKGVRELEGFFSVGESKWGIGEYCRDYWKSGGQYSNRNSAGNLVDSEERLFSTVLYKKLVPLIRAVDSE